MSCIQYDVGTEASSGTTTGPEMATGMGTETCSYPVSVKVSACFANCLVCFGNCLLGTVCEQVRGRYRLPRQIVEVADPVLPSSSRLSSHHQQKLPLTVRTFLSAWCIAFHLSLFAFQPKSQIDNDRALAVHTANCSSARRMPNQFSEDS